MKCKGNCLLSDCKCSQPPKRSTKKRGGCDKTC